MGKEAYNAGVFSHGGHEGTESLQAGGEGTTNLH